MIYCPLFSGSAGNATLLATDKSRLLIDAGKTGKAIEQALSQISFPADSLTGILVTHEHTDHIKSVGILSRKYNLPIYANKLTWESMQAKIGDISLQNIRIFNSNRDFFIGDCHITPHRISHDAADPVGFSFVHNQKIISHITDLGFFPESLYEIVGQADIAFIESNYDLVALANTARPASLKNRIRSKKGHLSNEDSAVVCARLAKLGCRNFVLGHLSRDANTPKLAFHTHQLSLNESGFILDKDVKMNIAYQNSIGGIYQI